jgi:hypothetical protein
MYGCGLNICIRSLLTTSVPFWCVCVGTWWMMPCSLYAGLWPKLECAVVGEGAREEGRIGGGGILLFGRYSCGWGRGTVIVPIVVVFN